MLDVARGGPLEPPRGRWRGCNWSPVPPRVGADPHQRFRPTRQNSASRREPWSLLPPGRWLTRLSWDPQARREAMAALKPRRRTYISYFRSSRASTRVDNVTCWSPRKCLRQTRVFTLKCQMTSRTCGRRAILRDDRRGVMDKLQNVVELPQTSLPSGGLLSVSCIEQDQPVGCLSDSMYVLRVLAWHAHIISTCQGCDLSGQTLSDRS